MNVLLLGATGATGKLVLKQLIKKEIATKIVVRDLLKIEPEIINNSLIECIEGNISEFTLDNYIKLLNDCNSVISCLGHNITLKGIFGEPRMLVSNCIKNICLAAERINQHKIKIVLMNTVACRNSKLNESYTFADRMLLSVLYHILPPQKDNETAAAYLLNVSEKENKIIEWVTVRPDTLINEKDETKYKLVPSPLRSSVFNSGKTSRINVSHFMVELISNEELWEQWKFTMPVIYNLSD